MEPKKQKFSIKIFDEDFLLDDYRTIIEDFAVAMCSALFSAPRYKELKVGKVSKYYETQPEIIYRDCGTKVSAGYCFIGVRISQERIDGRGMDVFSYLKESNIVVEHIIAVSTDIYKKDNLPLITDRIGRIIRGGYALNPLMINGENTRFRFSSDDRLFYSGSKFMEADSPIEIRSLKTNANVYVV